MVLLSYLCNSTVSSLIISLTYEKLDTCFQSLPSYFKFYHYVGCYHSKRQPSPANDMLFLDLYISWKWPISPQPLTSFAITCILFLPPQHCCNYIFTCGVLKNTVLVFLLDLHISLFIVHFQFLLSFSLFTFLIQLCLS